MRGTTRAFLSRSKYGGWEKKKKGKSIRGSLLGGGRNDRDVRIADALFGGCAALDWH